MTPIFQNTQTSAPPAPTAAEEFCAANGLDAQLPDRLVTDSHGEIFEPVAITGLHSPEDLAEHWTLLGRREPVGGFEALVRANRERIGNELLLRLQARLAGRSQIDSTANLLQGLLASFRQLRDRFAEEHEEAEGDYTSTNQSLRSWQEQTGKQQGLLRNLWGWMLGEDGRLSLPQAIAHWNEREHLELKRQSLAAALGIVNLLSDKVSTLLEQAAEVRAEALRARARVAQQLAALVAPETTYAPWSYRSNVAVSAAQLSAGADIDSLAVQLAGMLGGGGELHLADHAHQLALQEASRLLDPLTTPQLIELEASAEPVEGVDAVVQIGQQLLEQLQRQRGWRLAVGSPGTELEFAL